VSNGGVSNGGVSNGGVSNGGVSNSGTANGGVSNSGASGGDSAGTGATGGYARVVPQDRPAGYADDSYRPSSNWIRDAQANIDYVTRCARFWFKARSEAGGYYTYVLADGTPASTGGKLPITQSRDAYGFVRAFMVTGDEQFLEHATHALTYHYALWLPEGGWEPSHDSFFEHYALLGPAAMCEATGETTHCDWWDKAESNLDQHLWDSDPVSFGYFQSGSAGWESPNGKGFNATADALTTHDYARWLRDPTGREARIRALGENILTRFVGQIGNGGLGFGFPEYFSTSWSTYGQAALTGHVLKVSWLLSRLYLAFHEEQWRVGAEKALDEVLTKVWDTSLTYRFLSQGVPPEWWELEEAFNAGMLAYYTGRDAVRRASYLKVADEAIAAFHDVYDDPVNGETFKVPTNTTYKGDLYKAGYHTTETGYYSLLYGQLLYQHRPVALYYRFQPSAQARSIRLTPMVAPQLRIVAVSLNGEAFDAFDAVTRVLSIPSGVGGIFKVTYWVDDAAVAQ
jgi:mannose/cellobiose epimerase-like protein (N-acyl-D-glucosamine 2-epimerase family)